MALPYRRDQALRIVEVIGGVPALRARLRPTGNRVGLGRARAPRLEMPGIRSHFAAWLWGLKRDEAPLTLDVGAAIGPDGVTEAVVYALRGPRSDLPGAHVLRVELPEHGRAVVEVTDADTGDTVLRHVWPDEAYLGG